MLGDPYLYNSAYLAINKFNYGGYNYNTPNYFPGYGLAVIGNVSNTAPTLLNFGVNTGYTGFINVHNGAMVDRTDYDSTSRLIGRNTQLQTSVILDGNFNASAFYQIGDNSRVQGSEYLFKTNNLNLSSRNLLANNVNTYSTPSYKLQIFDDINNRVNFKYVNYVGSFSTLGLTYYGYSTWSFKPADAVVTTFKNSYLNVYNYNKTDSTYVYYFGSANPYIDLSNALLSIGSVNRLVPTVFNSSSNMYYVGIDGLQTYDTYYSLKSPFNSTVSGGVFKLNYYDSSVR
jgi:hypothetical protein